MYTIQSHNFTEISLTAKNPFLSAVQANLCLKMFDSTERIT